MVAEVVQRDRRETPRHLSALLAQVLLAYTLDFERESELSLPLGANFVRVLDEKGIDVRELPLVAGVSPEATSMALRFLEKNGYVGVETKTGTPHAEGPGRAGARTPDTRRRRGALGSGARRAPASGAARCAGPSGSRWALEPPPSGWRLTKRYAEQTRAVLDDPLAALPHYPMVLHRGGWPDGS